MNKRSAVLMALALTGALVAGGIALASGIGGPGTSDASTTTAVKRHQKPIVRTKTRTVTIHRKAKQPDGRVVVLSGSPSSSSGSSVAASSSSGTSTSSDDSYEHETEGPDDSGGTSSNTGGGDD